MFSQPRRAAAIVLLAIAHSAFANPTGPTVVSGTASISASGNTLTVTNSSGAIINWQGFSIGAAETTRFVQPSSSSTVLNRVTGSSASDIQGTLASNGRVFLVNPNGVLFGPGAQVNVAGLVASSLVISNADFLAGNYRFVNGGSAGPVVSRGTITTESGGSVALFAPELSVGGAISAPGGRIDLATGNAITLGASGELTIVQPSDHPLIVEDGLILNADFITVVAGLPAIVGPLVTLAVPEINAGPNITIQSSPAIAESGGSITLSSAQPITVNPSALQAGTVMLGAPGALTVAPSGIAVSPVAGVMLNLQKREVSF